MNVLALETSNFIAELWEYLYLCISIRQNIAIKSNAYANFFLQYKKNIQRYDLPSILRDVNEFEFLDL